MQTITARRNALVARFRDIARGDEPDTVLLDGLHLVSEALDAGLVLRHVMVSTDAVDRPEIRATLDALATRQVEVAAATSMVMDAVSPLRSASPIVAIADRPALDAQGMFATTSPLVLIAADVQDPGNLGAIIRVAEAGSASGVAVSGNSAHPFGWKALRGSMGSVLRLPTARYADTGQAVADARHHGCRIVATMPRDGVPYSEADFRGAIAILIGGEGGGISAEVAAAADVRITIPMRVPVESLNAAVAAAILVYEARRQRQSKFEL